MAQHMRNASDRTEGQQNYNDMKKAMGSDRASKLSHTDNKRNLSSRLSDLQVLQGIDSTDDPMGKHAM